MKKLLNVLITINFSSLPVIAQNINSSKIQIVKISDETIDNTLIQKV